MLENSPITASVETLQAILNAIPNPVFLKDRQHRLVVVNDAMCALMGQTREQMLAQGDEPLPGEQRDVFWRIDDLVFESGQQHDNEEVLTDGSGSLRVILTRKRLIHLPTRDGEQPFIVAVISDITRIRESEARTLYLAEHDTLTGLANRSQLDERLRATIAAAASSGHQAALLMLDIDRFKDVNDQYGHPVGDQLLSIVAKRLVGLVRPTDTVARLGGDEFCIVQGGLHQPSGAYSLAQRILTAIARPISIGSLSVSVTTSIGIAIFPDDGTTPEALLKNADDALYAVKRGGRHGCRRAEGVAEPHGAPAWNIESDLREALKNGQLSLAFQPLAAAADGKTRGFEALVRWQHPTRGAIQPQEFIPVAESCGLIHELGAWMLREACAAAQKWPWPLQVAINVSPVQLESRELLMHVRDALASSGLPASRLELEVTESALLDHSGHVMEMFSQLKALGVSLALDDFGAGWSSLATLHSFQFDRIKIDQRFISHIESDARAVAIVRAVLSLAQTLNVPVTAEGIEDKAQFLALRKMGCTELQGFYLGAPQAQAKLPDALPWLPPAAAPEKR
ncbi:putative bifunctional diguanylate cyclase/phosphodiesterase [Solimonas variicoloris]|uniref:putative bifunctional diguanylate cyclase/phosphodiesterase n=1 Tax=Solimonas variicoloris TaxID=254408 RepID=UPI0003671141|nr:GGDEF and EAL domain-containing protein [Solimonas variicoloris]